MGWWVMGMRKMERKVGGKNEGRKGQVIINYFLSCAGAWCECAVLCFAS